MSKDELIKRKDALGACAYETVECYEARKAIRAIPAVEPSIIRCRECIFKGHSNRTASEGRLWCMAHEYVISDDDYCSRAERAERKEQNDE